jgi:hypothetical protein
MDCDEPHLMSNEKSSPFSGQNGQLVHFRGRWGQSELITTNAPVGRSVHWMGCIFSFDIRWGSS